MRQRISPILKSSLEVMEHAIEHLNNGTEKDAKFAVLHADNSAELILKELVRFKRMRLIDKKGLAIRYYDCIDKLLDRGISIPELPDIDLLHTERNSIYHLGTQPNQEKAEWLVYDVGLSFLRRISKDEMGYDINNYSSLFKLTPEVEQEIALTRSEMINKYLVDIVACLNSNLYESAVLFSYVGIEVVFRESIKENVRSHRDMLNILREEKLISNTLFKDFNWLRNVRNQVAHGQYQTNEEEANFAFNIFKRVLEEIGLPLELKCKICGVQFKSGLTMSKKSFKTTLLKDNYHTCPKGHTNSYDKNDYIIKY